LSWEKERGRETETGRERERERERVWIEKEISTENQCKELKV
jgi:hypothetical protein